MLFKAELDKSVVRQDYHLETIERLPKAQKCYSV